MKEKLIEDLIEDLLAESPHARLYCETQTRVVTERWLENGSELLPCHSRDRRRTSMLIVLGNPAQIYVLVQEHEPLTGGVSHYSIAYLTREEALDWLKANE